jgi:hypothetical protein
VSFGAHSVRTGIYETAVRPAIHDAIRELGGKEKTKKVLMNWGARTPQRGI